jgi:hypothetical protein
MVELELVFKATTGVLSVGLILFIFVNLLSWKKITHKDADKIFLALIFAAGTAQAASSVLYMFELQPPYTYVRDSFSILALLFLLLGAHRFFKHTAYKYYSKKA